jgi:hypothetical protein
MEVDDKWEIFNKECIPHQIPRPIEEVEHHPDLES